MEQIESPADSLWHTRVFDERLFINNSHGPPDSPGELLSLDRNPRSTNRALLSQCFDSMYQMLRSPPSKQYLLFLRLG